MALPAKSTINPLKIRFIGEPLTNGYVTNCHILPCRTFWALIAKKLVVKPGANMDNNIPTISKIIIAVTPGVKSFVGEGKVICVCPVVYIITCLHIYITFPSGMAKSINIKISIPYDLA